MKLDAAKQISAGVPGTYRFELTNYVDGATFLSEFRRYEGISRAKGYVFVPSLNSADEPPFDAFEVTIQATGREVPFVAHSRKGMSRKLPRM